MSSISHECTKRECWYCREMKRLEELKVHGHKEYTLDPKSCGVSIYPERKEYWQQYWLENKEKKKQKSLNRLLSDSMNEEQSCANCKYCREDKFLCSLICENHLQIHSLVNPDDYCFRHEYADTERR